MDGPEVFEDDDPEVLENDRPGRVENECPGIFGGEGPRSVEMAKFGIGGLGKIEVGDRETGADDVPGTFENDGPGVKVDSLGVSEVDVPKIFKVDGGKNLENSCS